MFGKKKIFGIILITGLLLYMPGGHVSAEEIPEDLPVIVRWEEGGGFDSAGNRITQCWAYDTVSEAGKYVLFDENGAVQKKADNWEDREEAGEYFTSTEQETGVIALRSGISGVFEGEISVVVGEENGTAKEYVLSPDNLYEFNISVHSGMYQIQKAEAADALHVYQTEYNGEPFRMEENGLFLCTIQVTDQITGEVQQEQQDTSVIAGDHPEEENEEERRQEMSGKKAASHRDSGGERKANLQPFDLKYWFLGVGMVVILAAGLWIRSRKNKYH